MPECQGIPCSKQARNLKFKWLQLDSNPQPLSGCGFESSCSHLKSLVLTNMFWDLWVESCICKFWRDWKFSKCWLLLSLLLKRFYASFLFWIKRLIELSIQDDLCYRYLIISCGIKICNIFLIVLVNKWIMSLTIIFWNNFSHWKPLIAFLIWLTFTFRKCHTLRSYGGGKTTLRLNLENTIWWRQFWCKQDWTPESTTKFVWEANIKSMQEDLFPIIWVGSWISCSSPNYHQFYRLQKLFYLKVTILLFVH